MAKLKGKAKAAFLAKMARGRNKKKRARKRSRGHTHASHHERKSPRKGRRKMAKRRKSSFRTRARRVGRRAARGIGKFVPNNQELLTLGTCYAYGKLETAADKDAKHALNSVPTFVPQAGRSGNLAIAAWVAAKLIKKPAVHAIALGVANIALYQQGRGSGFAAGKQNFTMGASRSTRARDEQMVENYLQGLGPP
jgi:hypothetical protein